MQQRCNGACGTAPWTRDQLRRWSDDHGGPREARRLAPPNPFPSTPLRGRAAMLDRELEGRASQPEHRWKTAARWKGTQRRAGGSPDELPNLRDRTMLHLGDSKVHGPLLAILPRGQQPLTPARMMLDELLPELDQGWALGRAEAALRLTGARRPGLFWRGPVAYHAGGWCQAMLRLAGGQAPRPMVAGPMPASYRDTLPPDRSRVVEDGQGRVRLTGASPPLCWSCDGTQHVLEHGRGLAAMADYHLWWAHRLHSHVHAESGNPWDLWMGRLAARKALSYLDRLGDTLRHLDGHEAASLQQR